MRLDLTKKIGVVKTYKVACDNTLQEIQPSNNLQKMIKLTTNPTCKVSKAL